MILSEGIINKELFARPDDHPDRVLEMMENFELSGIPVISDRLFCGVLLKETLQNMPLDLQTIKNLPLKLSFLFENTHVLDGVIFFKVHHINFIPLIDKNHQYIGFLDPLNLLKLLDELLNSVEAGVIICLEMEKRDYSLAKISHILESNNIHIISSFSRSILDSNNLELTLKVSKENSSRALEALQRYQYNIIRTFHLEESEENLDLMSRYENLMNYINM